MFWYGPTSYFSLGWSPPRDRLRQPFVRPPRPKQVQLWPPAIQPVAGPYWTPAAQTWWPGAVAGLVQPE